MPRKGQRTYKNRRMITEVAGTIDSHDIDGDLNSTIEMFQNSAKHISRKYGLDSNQMQLVANSGWNTSYWNIVVTRPENDEEYNTRVAKYEKRLAQEKKRKEAKPAKIAKLRKDLAAERKALKGKEQKISALKSQITALERQG